MKIRIAALILVLVFIFSGCSKKEPPPPPEPQGPFDYSELAELNDASPFLPEVSYAVPDTSRKIAFKKAYRCETLFAASETYFNAVVLQVDSQDMEATQAAMSERRTAYLVNEMNTPYRIYGGYTLLHDPVDHNVYLVYETGADTFSPDFHYFVLGDFTPREGGNKNLIFDIGDLLEYADISPITATQELPDEETLEQIQEALSKEVVENDFSVVVEVVKKRVSIIMGASYQESESELASITKDLYLKSKDVCKNFSVKIDQFMVTFWDQSGTRRCAILAPMLYEFPYDFSLVREETPEDFEPIEVLERPEISGPNTADITLAEYDKIKEGDSYVRVKKIVGGAGQLVLKENIFDSTYEIYEWHGADGISIAQIYFENGAMYSKAQYGLS